MQVQVSLVLITLVEENIADT